MADMEDDSQPIEFIKTDLSDVEVFREPKANSVMYL